MSIEVDRQQRIDVPVISKVFWQRHSQRMTMIGKRECSRLDTCSLLPATEFSRRRRPSVSIQFTRMEQIISFNAVDLAKILCARSTTRTRRLARDEIDFVVNEHASLMERTSNANVCQSVKIHRRARRSTRRRRRRRSILTPASIRKM